VSIRKRGNTYQVRLPGERARTFPTKKSAVEWELERRVARAAGVPGIRQVRDETWAAAAAGTLHRWQVRSNPAPSTYKRAEESLRPLKTFDQVLLRLVGLVEFEDRIVELAAHHPNQAKKTLEWGKRVLRDAQRRGQLFDARLLEVEPVRCTSRKGIVLDVDQLQRLGSWFPEQLAIMPEILGTVGLRLGEARTLTQDRVDLKAGLVFIPAELCKERRDKTIQLAGFEVELFAAQLLLRPPGSHAVFPRAGGHGHAPGGMWAKRNFYSQVWHPAREAAANEWRKDHGLAEWETTPFCRIVPHDLRHSAISSMARGGMTPEAIAERVGHADGGRLILERYRHLFPDEMPTQLQRYAESRRLRLAGGQDVDTAREAAEG
jgi:integrase